MYAAPAGSSRPSIIEKVGRDGFLQKPIGAGPYKLVSQEPGTRLVFEAFEDYYRPVHVKHFEILGVPDAATRLAMVEREEADIVYSLPGELLPRVKRNTKIMLAPVLSGSWWLDFPVFQDPNNPFHDKRVRQAVSLAIDRKAINEAESGGWGKINGNWINDDVEYALEWPEWEYNVAKAKELMKEAGHPNGFKVDWLTVVPPYFSRGERVISQLKAIGIQTRLQTHGTRRLYQEARRRSQGVAGRADHHERRPHRRQLGQLVRRLFKCGGFLGQDMFCVKDLDAKFEQYQNSFDRHEREKLAEEIQRDILENHYFVPVFRHAAVNAIGPRIKAENWQDVFPTITTATPIPGRISS